MPVPKIRDYQVTEGEAILVQMKPLPNEPRNLYRGHLLHVCCGCGLRHLITFESLMRTKKVLSLIMRFFLT